MGLLDGRQAGREGHQGARTATLLEKAGAIRDGGSYEERMGGVACWNAVMDENDVHGPQVERVHRGLSAALSAVIGVESRAARPASPSRWLQALPFARGASVSFFVAPLPAGRRR